MNAPDIMQHNRVILAHFDSYSAALLFVRWNDQTMLWPQALPESSSSMERPATVGAEYDGAAVREAMIERCGLNPAEVVLATDFEHWEQTAAGPVRVHLLRFTTPEAPAAVVAPLGGVFKHLPQLRGTAMSELLLLREVFNLMIAAGGARA